MRGWQTSPPAVWVGGRSPGSGWLRLPRPALFCLLVLWGQCVQTVNRAGPGPHISGASPLPALWAPGVPGRSSCSPIPQLHSPLQPWPGSHRSTAEGGARVHTHLGFCLVPRGPGLGPQQLLPPAWPAYDSRGAPDQHLGPLRPLWAACEQRPGLPPPVLPASRRPRPIKHPPRRRQLYLVDRKSASPIYDGT